MSLSSEEQEQRPCGCHQTELTSSFPPSCLSEHALVTHPSREDLFCFTCVLIFMTLICDILFLSKLFCFSSECDYFPTNGIRTWLNITNSKSRNNLGCLSDVLLVDQLKWHNTGFLYNILRVLKGLFLV